MINQLPTGIFRQILLDQLAKKTGLTSETLTQLLPPAAHEEPTQWSEIPPDNGNYEDYDSHYENTGYHKNMHESTEHEAIENFPTSDSYPPAEDYGQPDNQPQPRANTAKKRTPLAQKGPLLKPLHWLIALLINHPSLTQKLEHKEELVKLELDDIEILRDLLALLTENPDYTLNHILGYWRGVHGQEKGEILAGIAANDLVNIPGQATENYVKQAQDIIDSLLLSAVNDQTIEQRIEYLSAKKQLNDHDRNTAFAIWLELPATARNPDLINKIKQLLERKDETSR